MLTLVKDVTYTELQKLIYQAVDVPADKQKIRVGFPPKLLEPAADGEEEVIVPLHHGDKIALEVLPDFDAVHEGNITTSFPSIQASVVVRILQSTSLESQVLF